MNFPSTPVGRSIVLALIGLGMCTLSADARSFKSSLDLKVYANGTDGQQDRLLGSTSKTSKAVKIPGSEYWYVRPVGTLNEAKLVDLAIELRNKQVPGLDLSNRWDIRDVSLASLEGIKTLRFLLLYKTQLTDAALEHLSDMTGLNYLALNNKMTDKGLVHLEGLPNLTGVDLSGTKITDKGLIALGQWPQAQNIEVLTLGPKMTDAGLKPIAALKNLRSLDAREAKITELGLAALRQSPNLEELSLSWKTLSRQKIQALGNLTHIKRVVLNGKVMPPAVLEKIRSLAQLEAPHPSTPSAS